RDVAKSTRAARSGQDRRSLTECPQHRPQMGQRSTTMAQGVLDARTQLAERLMIFRDEKERIVAEATRAAMFAQNDAVTAPLDGGADVALRIGEHGGTDVV